MPSNLTAFGYSAPVSKTSDYVMRQEAAAEAIAYDAFCNGLSWADVSKDVMPQYRVFGRLYFLELDGKSQFRQPVISKSTRLKAEWLRCQALGTVSSPAAEAFMESKLCIDADQFATQFEEIVAEHYANAS